MEYWDWTLSGFFVWVRVDEFEGILFIALFLRIAIVTKSHDLFQTCDLHNYEFIIICDI